MAITQEELQQVQEALLYVGCLIHPHILSEIEDLPGFEHKALKAAVAAERIIGRELDHDTLHMDHDTFMAIADSIPEDTRVSVIFPDKDEPVEETTLEDSLKDWGKVFFRKRPEA